MMVSHTTAEVVSPSVCQKTISPMVRARGSKILSHFSDVFCDSTRPGGWLVHVHYMLVTECILYILGGVSVMIVSLVVSNDCIF